MLHSTDTEDAASCSLGSGVSARVRGDSAQPLRILIDSLGCGFSALVRWDRAQPLLLLSDVHIYVRRHLNQKKYQFVATDASLHSTDIEDADSCSLGLVLVHVFAGTVRSHCGFSGIA